MKHIPLFLLLTLIGALMLITLFYSGHFNYGHCYVITFVSVGINDSLIGENIDTRIYFHLYNHFNGQYLNIAIADKIFSGTDMYEKYVNYINKYTQVNKKYACQYRKEHSEYVYLNDPDKDYYNYSLIIFSVYAGYLIILALVGSIYHFRKSDYNNIN